LSFRVFGISLLTDSHGKGLNGPTGIFKLFRQRFYKHIEAKGLFEPGASTFSFFPLTLFI